jgi:phosphatidylserine/phosphatidylglycerophosphate/cardiolipin synthase-like enzyme
VSSPTPTPAVTLALAFAGLLAVGAVVPAVALGPAERSDDRPRIAAAYPDPIAEGDRGEFVVVSAARNTTLSDGEGSVRVPVDGTVALSAAPNRTRNLTDHRVVGVALPSLANGGEVLTLTRDGERLARVEYDTAREGAIRRWRYDGSGGDGWAPLGRTDRPVVDTDGGPATAFVLPDAPGPPVETLERADERVLFAGYTFASERATRALLAAHRRGVAVRVLLDGGPVGGISRRSARLLDRLADAGVEVRVLAGPSARYRFHHAKYAVVDERALVLTENWKPAGTGGNGSRGWGVSLRDPEAAAALAATFRADAGWRAAVPWQEFRAGRRFEPRPAANGTFPSRVAPAPVSVTGASVLVAPENAGDALVERLDAAEESVRVLQVSVDGPDQRFLRAAVRAAERGVEVRVLLSGAWYVREENRALAERLNARADREDLPLTVRLARPAGRFEKVHAKGVVVDDTVLLGSLNWNPTSARENREVVVALESEGAARYFAGVFDEDWAASAERAGQGGRGLPVGLLGAVAAGALVALLVASRLEFGGGRGF